jgi:hypothetical protein
VVGTLFPVKYMPGLPHAPLERQWAGYLSRFDDDDDDDGDGDGDGDDDTDEKNGTDGDIWSWYFERRVDAATAPLVVWLQGGPGTWCNVT